MSPSDPKSNPKQSLTGDVSAEVRVATRFVHDGNQFSSDSLQQLLRDPDSAGAVQNIDRVWQGIGQNANRPEFLTLREQALARARRANRRRWSLPWTDHQRSWVVAAGVVGVAIAAGLAWQLSPYGYRPGVYQTGIGEQRTIELSDGSRIALDSRTRIRATLTADARTIEITQGQAQFNVIHDPARPFKVIAGDHTIVDVGTVFTVEYVDKTVQVALLEGKVSVLTPEAMSDGDASVGSAAVGIQSPPGSGSAPQAIELSAGEELRFAQNGKAIVTPQADIQAATAWREGKVIFHEEPLREAVRRLNRYSKTQLQIDGPELADLSINGVFEAGDSRAFAQALEAYLPVIADYSQGDVIKLRMK